jgi:CBS-domain-containing membrane protein
MRRRTVVEGSGQGTEHITVYCPRDERSAPVDECLHCPEWAGLYRPGGVRTAVFCRHHTSGRAAEAETASKRCTLRSEAGQTALRSVMTGHVICVRPSLAIAELTELLLDRGIAGVPVVDCDGRPIGVISKTDVLASGGKDTVADHMMPIAFSLPEEASLLRAASLMTCEGVHRIPVVAADGSVVGIISALDVVRWLAQQSAALDVVEDGR